MRLKTITLLLGAALALMPVGGVQAGSVNAAVAANFTKVAETLAADFKAKTSNDVVLSFGATGALYTQITQGAPFEVFLSADSKRPATAITDGFGVEGTAFTYAIGKLALYSPSLDVSEQVLKDATFAHIAIADPAAAPYGAAAMEVLKALGIEEAITPKIVTGTSIAQTQQFIETGNAELGFLALSQVIGKEHVWLVPDALYSPIKQDAVLLKTGEANPVAAEFLAYLKSPEAIAIIESAGYTVK